MPDSTLNAPGKAGSSAAAPHVLGIRKGVEVAGAVLVDDQDPTPGWIVSIGPRIVVDEAFFEVGVVEIVLRVARPGRERNQSPLHR
jgi:hypothetical protein